MASPTLDSCPLCGHRPYIKSGKFTAGPIEQTYWTAMCLGCGMGNDDLSPDKTTAADTWHRKCAHCREVIAMPLNECPRCHVMPKADVSCDRTQTVLRCPDCDFLAIGFDAADTKEHWNRKCADLRQKEAHARRQAVILAQICKEVA